MTWRGLMIAGLLVFLSFSVSVAHAQVGNTRDPFSRIGVAVPQEQPVAKPTPPKPRRWARPAPKPVVPVSAQYNSMPFAVWLDQFKAEAVTKGIPPMIVEDAFRGMAPNDTVVRLDRKQPEDKISWTQYKTNTALNSGRIARGKKQMKEHAELLKKISATYRVPAAVIVALWGTETEYGANKGNFSLIQSLTTLAYEGRRADFFRSELLNALQIMRDEKVMGATLTGSWAGAMGHCQFMPSSYLKYAVDWDRDGHRDIWNSVPDALASIANYLKQSGWNEHAGLQMKVTLPTGFPPERADLYKAQTIQHWRDAGVATADGKRIEGNSSEQTYVMFPGTPQEEAYMVTDNYHVLLKWNRSRYFASSVSLLAETLSKP